MKVSAGKAAINEEIQGLKPWISHLSRNNTGILPYIDAANFCRASAHDANHVATLRKSLEGNVPSSGNGFLESLHPIAKHIKDLHTNEGLFGHSHCQDILTEGHVQPGSLAGHNRFRIVRTRAGFFYFHARTRLHLGAAGLDHITTRRFHPPIGFRYRPIYPLRSRVTFWVHGIALALFHIAKTGIVAMVAIVAGSIHKGYAKAFFRAGGFLFRATGLF